MKHKDFFRDDGKFFIEAEEVSQAVFEERRLKECWHRLEDERCIDCGLEVSNA